MYCKNLTKKINGKLRCKIIKQEITLDWCKKCHNFEPRVNKPINKKSNHKKELTNKTRLKVLQRDKGCRLCDEKCFGNIEIHHIRYRSEDINLIDDPNNCIALCTYHHELVHSNKHYWQPKLLEMMK